MARQERVRPTPRQDNHEAERMLNEAQQRQEAQAAKRAGKLVTQAETEAILDEIDDLIREGELVDATKFTQKGGQ